VSALVCFILTRAMLFLAPAKVFAQRFCQPFLARLLLGTALWGEARNLGHLQPRFYMPA
jgi:hypothetical protein